jgi:hypothetical protein
VLNKVICVCTRKDALTFEITAHYINRFIKSKSYIVIVPDVDFDYFASLNLTGFTIISEKKYAHIGYTLSKKSVGKRYGWYFQQFIKMAELDDGLNNDVNLIWDADTIPLREISFEKNGSLYFYQGKEHHSPYFDLIKKLLDENKQVETSFIAQCLPYRAGWFRDFKENLEKDTKYPWYQRIIDLIDFNEDSGFSEYETLGTYASKNFSSGIKINAKTNDWYRFGNSLIGGPQNIIKYENILKANYNFVSFESWDNKRMSPIKRFLELHLLGKMR